MKLPSSLPSYWTAAAAIAALAAAPTVSAADEGNSAYPAWLSNSTPSSRLLVQLAMTVDANNHDEVDELEYLREKAPTDAGITAKNSTGEVRIFMAAVADMMHYGK